MISVSGSKEKKQICASVKETVKNGLKKDNFQIKYMNDIWSVVLKNKDF